MAAAIEIAVAARHIRKARAAIPAAACVRLAGPASTRHADSGGTVPALAIAILAAARPCFSERRPGVGAPRVARRVVAEHEVIGTRFQQERQGGGEEGHESDDRPACAHCPPPTGGSASAASTAPRNGLSGKRSR